MSATRIILIHFILLVASVAVLFFSAEPLLRKFAVGLYDIGMFISLLVGGSIVIFLVLLISCILFLIFKRKKPLQDINAINVIKNNQR